MQQEPAASSSKAKKNHSRSDERLIDRVEKRLRILREDENRLCSCPPWRAHAADCPTEVEIRTLEAENAARATEVGVALRVKIEEQLQRNAEPTTSSSAAPAVRSPATPL